MKNNKSSISSLASATTTRCGSSLVLGIIMYTVATTISSLVIIEVVVKLLK